MKNEEKKTEKNNFGTFLRHTIIIQYYSNLLVIFYEKKKGNLKI